VDAIGAGGLDEAEFGEGAFEVAGGPVGGGVEGVLGVDGIGVHADAFEIPGGVEELVREDFFEKIGWFNRLCQFVFLIWKASITSGWTIAFRPIS